MACQCLVNAAGYTFLALVGYKLLSVFIRILGPYLLFPGVDLKNKAKGGWAVVTGATDGIGKAYAFELARRGFNIVLVSRTQSKLNDVKKELNEKFSNTEVRTFAFDFARSMTRQDYQPMIDELNKLEVGVLVNNVGMSYDYPESLHKMEGGLDRVTDITVINTLPVTLLTAALLPQMVDRHAGIVVNLSSASANYPMALWAVYSSTKKYVQWLSEILRREYANKGITIQTISPMLVCSNMSKVKRSSFFTPNATSFARSAVSTIGKTDDTSGYMSHQIQVEIMGLLPSFVRDYLINSMSTGTRAAALKKKAREAKNE
ncbi:hypothetical protein WR25_17306 [Diploscapter pachys]|uniref:Very-long-chain 3-oxoacyl-CoA reductase n=1 Tax=Diploscapter pachys TaxID=2018661 RepID=A0A2A2L6G7_9BILA|nr:hypothetical protein WR25_17306 [Diploscapter pachys]